MAERVDSRSAVHFLDIGQAHATVAVDADSAVVVDCPQRGVQPASEVLAMSDPVRLDVVVTHRDLDHCGGVHELIRRFGNSATKLYLNAAMSVSPHPTDQPRVKAVLRSILSAADEVGARAKHALRGEVGLAGTIGWVALAPTHRQVLDTAVGGSVNRSSVVLRLELAGYRFLIPGDIDDNAVAELLRSGAEISANVFLLPHHGAKLQRFSELLAAVDPRYIVVSAGRRPFHPALETLHAAAAFDCRIMCTEVATHCHRGAIDPQHCAGSIVFKLRGGSLEAVPSEAEHMVRIRHLDTPVCLGSSRAVNQQPECRRP